MSSQNRLTHLECSRCGADDDAHELHQRCSRCGGTLLCRYDLTPGPVDLDSLMPPVDDPISLGEGKTPLLQTSRAGVWIKDDSLMPGGTFKARGASVALSRARQLGVREVVMPSAGNAGGAWALYAARGGIELTVTMAKSAPATNQAEVLTAGAKLELVDGTIADAGARAAEIAEETGAFLAATFNEPYRLEGKKKAWLEVFDQLGLPGTIILPVGGGVAGIAAAKAAEEVRALGWFTDKTPVIIGVQAANCAPIAQAFEQGVDEVKPWEGPAMSIAAGLRVPAPVEGTLVLKTIRDSGGSVVKVTEEEISDAITGTARSEGIWMCPEGATTVAALQQLRGLPEPIVLYNTGAGFKYADALST